MSTPREGTCTVSQNVPFGLTVSILRCRCYRNGSHYYTLLGSIVFIPVCNFVSRNRFKRQYVYSEYASSIGKLPPPYCGMKRPPCTTAVESVLYLAVWDLCSYGNRSAGVWHWHMSPFPAGHQRCTQLSSQHSAWDASDLTAPKDTPCNPGYLESTCPIYIYT